MGLKRLKPKNTVLDSQRNIIEQLLAILLKKKVITQVDLDQINNIENPLS